MTRNGTPDALADTRVELLVARCEALDRALGEVLEYVRKVGGFMTPENQSLMREAAALRVMGEGK